MFGFSIVKPPFGFTDVKTITIPRTQELEPAFNVNVGSEKLMLY